MENADMESADIEKADMENADMENAYMENADMENADMETRTLFLNRHMVINLRKYQYKTCILIPKRTSQSTQ